VISSDSNEVVMVGNDKWSNGRWNGVVIVVMVVVVSEIVVNLMSSIVEIKYQIDIPARYQ
jgi:hypothetical protein